MTDSEGYENLVLSNNGEETINYTIIVDGNPDWLELSQYEGSLPSTEWDEINLTFSSFGLDTGIYQTTLEVSAENITTRYIPVTLVVIDDVGVNEQSGIAPLIIVFPNPFSSEINVHIKDRQYDNLTIEIYNQWGELVFNELLNSGRTPLTLNWKTDQSGIYFYRMLQNTKTIATGKLIRL